MWARGRVACEPSCHSMVKRVPLALAESTSPSRRRPLRSHDTRRPSSSCTMIGALLTGGGGRLAVAAGASGTSSSSRMSARVTCATFGRGSNSGCQPHGVRGGEGDDDGREPMPEFGDPREEPRPSARRAEAFCEHHHADFEATDIHLRVRAVAFRIRGWRWNSGCDGRGLDRCGTRGLDRCGTCGLDRCGTCRCCGGARRLNCGACHWTSRGQWRRLGLNRPESHDERAGGVRPRGVLATVG